MSENLSDTQQLFIHNYINSKGDFYGTIENLGLEMAHILAWRKNPAFNHAYKQAQKDVIELLNSENYITAKKRVNEALIQGITETSRTSTHKQNPTTGELEYEVKTTIKQRATPIWAIQYGLESSDTLKAINLLMNEGFFPPNIARKLLAVTDKIQAELQGVFEEEKKVDVGSDKRMLALMKQVFYGEEIE